MQKRRNIRSSGASMAPRTTRGWMQQTAAAPAEKTANFEAGKRKREGEGGEGEEQERERERRRRTYELIH